MGLGCVIATPDRRGLQIDIAHPISTYVTALKATIDCGSELVAKHLKKSLYPNFMVVSSCEIKGSALHQYLFWKIIIEEMHKTLRLSKYKNFHNWATF